MATKQLNTRIRVRYDTLSNWNTNNPDLLKGEIAVVEIQDGDRVNQPAYLIKVGTGESGTTTSYGGATGQPAINKTSFKALPYVTAQAGDVYSWAKQEKLHITQDSDIHADTKTYLQNLVAGEIHDTDTQYTIEVGTGTDTSNGQNGGLPNQIRLKYKEKSANSYSYGDWISTGVTVAAGDGIAVSTANGTSTVSAKISTEDNNALSHISTSGKEGLYVHETTIQNPQTSTETTSSDTVNVVTAIAQDSTNKYQLNLTKEVIYTKKKIDDLINPGMEFKGVISPTSPATEVTVSNIPTSGVKKGDSYKFGAAGTIGSTNGVDVKAGDLIIALKDNPSAILEDNTNWALIPAGDDVEDTHRTIKVGGTELLDNTLSSGYVNFKPDTATGKTGIEVTGSGHDITIGIDQTTIATKSSVDALNTHTGGLGTYDDNGTTTNHTVKTYVDSKFNGITNSLADIATTGKATDLSTADDEYLILFGGTSWNDFVDSTVAADHTTT